MVRHWILIPAFPGSNPGSAVFSKKTLHVSFFVYRKENCILIKEKTLREDTHAHSFILY